MFCKHLWGDGYQTVSCHLSLWDRCLGQSAVVWWPQWMLEGNFKKVEAPVSADTECSSGSSFPCTWWMQVPEPYLGGYQLGWTKSMWDSCVIAYTVKFQHQCLCLELFTTIEIHYRRIHYYRNSIRAFLTIDSFLSWQRSHSLNQVRGKVKAYSKEQKTTWTRGEGIKVFSGKYRNAGKDMKKTTCLREATLRGGRKTSNLPFHVSWTA